MEQEVDRHIDQIPPQSLEPEPSNPPLVRATSPDLEAMLTHILAPLWGIQKQAPTQVPKQVLVSHINPATVALEIQQSLPLDIVQPDVLDIDMIPREKKILGVFLRLTSSWFTKKVSEDSKDFLTTCPERLHTQGLVESKEAVKVVVTVFHEEQTSWVFANDVNMIFFW